jgi:hypothetical protein
VCSSRSGNQRRLHHENNDGINGHVGPVFKRCCSGIGIEIITGEELPALGPYVPARTTVPGVEWGKGVLIEVDAIALRAAD